MKILQPAGWPRPKGYANGVSATGRMIFTAGMIGWDEREMIVSHRLDAQFGQALRNIVAVLAEDGAGPEHIVRLTVYITDRSEYLSSRDELAAIWKEVMGSHYPAMALVEVKALVNSAALVEIEATAVVPE
jgi:enamine deaminase RidA (YjgF/YER057c/UK114 family)